MINSAVYSDSKEISEFQIELNSFNLTQIEVVQDADFRINWDADIFVLSISGFESPLWKIFGERENLAADKVFITTFSNDALFVATAVKAGFTNIYLLPEENLQFRNDLNKVLELMSNQKNARKINENSDYLFELFVGKSEHAEGLRELIQNISKTPQSSLMILGETGTGKGLLAKIIHDLTHPNNSQPFVDIMATAIPENLLESELFGYEKGAFTDAHSAKKGLFELAGHGTIFLDEIGDISLNLQAKLLRVLERKEIRRVGGLKVIPFHARIITATNQNLMELVEKKKFREDLYYRINSIPIELQPLRERGDDVIDIAEYYLSVYCTEFNNFFYELSSEVKQLFKFYNWPGNVRELKNAIERAVMLNESQTTLELKHFPQILKNVKGFFPRAFALQKNKELIKLEIDHTQTNLRDIERLYAIELLNKFDGNKTLTAKALGISRPKLNSLLAG